MINLQASKFKTMSQMFVEKYQEIEREQPSLDEGSIFKATEKALKVDGIHLRPKPLDDKLQEEQVYFDTTDKKVFGKDIDKETLKI